MVRKEKKKEKKNDLAIGSNKEHRIITLRPPYFPQHNTVEFQ